MSETDDRMGRRDALVGVAAVAAGAWLGAERSGPAANQKVPDAPLAHGLAAPDGAVRALLGPIREGVAIGTWHLDAIYAVRLGAIPVVMRTADGERFAVEVFRADLDGPMPVGDAGPLAVFLSNRGRGNTPSTEEHGLGARALAQALRERITLGAPIPEQLTTQRERSGSSIGFIPV